MRGGEKVVLRFGAPNAVVAAVVVFLEKDDEIVALDNGGREDPFSVNLEEKERERERN